MPSEKAPTRSGTQFLGGRFLIVSASLVIVVAGLRAIKPIALPLVIAILLSVLSAPLVAWLARHKVPQFLSVIAAVLANIAVVLVMMMVVSGSIKAFLVSIPEYQQRLEGEVRSGLDWLESRGIELSAELIWLQEYLREEQVELPPEPAPSPEPSADERVASPDRGSPRPRGPAENRTSPNVIDTRALVDVLIDGTLSFFGIAIRSLAELATMALLIFLMMIFILSEAAGLPRKLEEAFGWNRSQLARLASARREIQRYLFIKTAISLFTGLFIGLWVWMLGLDYPQLWGLIAFLLNYIPSLGSFLAAIPAVLLAMIEMGPASAFLVAVGYLIVNIALGNLIEPQLLGRRLGISTLVVFLSLVFWGWVWGPIGMLLSVPITMILKILLEYTEDFHWFARLIGSSPPAVPSPPTTG